LETLPPIFHPHSSNAHAGSENYGQYLFGGQLANVISKLPNSFIAALLATYKAESPAQAKRAPSIETAKAVLKELALHTTTRPRNGVATGQPWVAEGITQLQDFTAFGEDQVKNALSFWTWADFQPTLKKGGKGRPTIRQVRLPDPELLRPYLSGREMPHYVLSLGSDQSGKADDQSGKVADQSGSSPATPRDFQALSKPRKPAPRSNAARGKRESCQSCGGETDRWQFGVGWIPIEQCRECKPPIET
jgi:hypothetical protein